MTHPPIGGKYPRRHLRRHPLSRTSLTDCPRTWRFNDRPSGHSTAGYGHFDPGKVMDTLRKSFIEGAYQRNVPYEVGEQDLGNDGSLCRL